MEEIKDSLFGDLDDFTYWKPEWRDMPEFTQGITEPKKSLTVHFRDHKDMDEFAKMIDQRITPKTVSLWYPKYDLRPPSDFIYEGKEEI